LPLKNFANYHPHSVKKQRKQDSNTLPYPFASGASKLTIPSLKDEISQKRR